MLDTNIYLNYCIIFISVGTFNFTNMSQKKELALERLKEDIDKDTRVSLLLLLYEVGDPAMEYYNQARHRIYLNYTVFNNNIAYCLGRLLHRAASLRSVELENCQLNEDHLKIIMRAIGEQVLFNTYTVLYYYTVVKCLVTDLLSIKVCSC